MTFEEMCAERDPLYAAMKPVGCFYWAVKIDATRRDDYRDGDTAIELLRLTIRALRNQGQPYYDAR